MAADQKHGVTPENQKDRPKAAERKIGSAKRDASARAKAIMARFPKTMARLAE